jgi:hypothetical protein
MGFCDDPAWDRGRARAVIAHYVASFLRAELTDEPDAKSALSSGGSAVPHVRYRTVGY